MQIACKKPCCARQAVLITDCASAKAISRTIQFLQEKDKLKLTEDVKTNGVTELLKFNKVNKGL